MTAPRPMIAGPRTVLWVMRAPASTTTLPRISLSSTVPLVARHQGVEDDAIRLQHVLEPTGILPPALDDVRAHEIALSISHWMASVISSSPRADGLMALTALKIVESNM